MKAFLFLFLFRFLKTKRFSFSFIKRKGIIFVFIFVFVTKIGLVLIKILLEVLTVQESRAMFTCSSSGPEVDGSQSSTAVDRSTWWIGQTPRSNTVDQAVADGQSAAAPKRPRSWDDGGAARRRAGRTAERCRRDYEGLGKATK